MSDTFSFNRIGEWTNEIIMDAEGSVISLAHDAGHAVISVAIPTHETADLSIAARMVRAAMEVWESEAGVGR